MFDHVGHGLVGARESGGRGRISNWWIDAAPWRCDGAEAVGAGVAAADDHDALARGRDGRFVDVALLHPVAERQVLHRLVDAAELASGDREVAPDGRAAGEDDGVELGAQVLHTHVDADVRAGAELSAFVDHLLDAALEVTLLQLELRDAVAQQTADAISALEHDDTVPGARELLRGRQTGRPRPHDRDALARLHLGDLGRDPAFVPRTVDDLHLDLFDGDRVGVDPEHA